MSATTYDVALSNYSTKTNFSSNVSDVEMTTENVTCLNEMCVSNEDYLQEIENHVFPEVWEWVFVGIYILTFLLGTTGNFLVCFAVWRNRFMRTVTNIFIVNLAVADLLIFLVCLTPTLVSDITETWFVGFIMCKIVTFLVTVSISVSVLTLSAIAVERWYAICFPLVFKSTKRRAIVIITGIWILSALVALPDLIVNTLVHYFPPEFTILLTSCKPGWSSENQTIYQFVIMVILYLIPIILMTITYTHISLVLWKGNIPGAAESVRKPMVNTKHASVDPQLESRRKAAKMLITIVVVFAVCYFPVHLLNVLRYTGVLYKMQPKTVIALACICHWLPYFNSSINPFVYNFMSEKFRKEFLNVCSCLRMRRRRITGRLDMSISTTSPHYQGVRHFSNSHTENITLTNFHDDSSLIMK